MTQLVITSKNELHSLSSKELRIELLSMYKELKETMNCNNNKK